MSLSKRARADELAKVTSLKARTPYISQSAFGALLRITKQEHLPQVSTRKAIREARNKHVTMATPYGPVHQRIDLGGGVSAEVQHPMAMLYAASASSPAFAVLLRRALSRFPCSPVSPWELILYTDEVSPGNQLAYAHERETWAWYWPFIGYGQSLPPDDVRTHTHIYIYIYIYICMLCVATTY